MCYSISRAKQSLNQRYQQTQVTSVSYLRILIGALIVNGLGSLLDPVCDFWWIADLCGLNQYLLPAKSSNVRFRVSTVPFLTSSPRAARRSSMLPGSPNHPSRSAIRWRLLHPPHLTTTTPFSYDSRQAVFTDLVSQTLQVKTMARSCLEDVFRFDMAENLTWGLWVSSGAVGTTASRASSDSSVVLFMGSVIVCNPLPWMRPPLNSAFNEGKRLQAELSAAAKVATRLILCLR